ncbi:ribose 5-phosphate isomerase A [Pedobacter sp. AW31-3R]|uniref:ribose 5-phosphate isomerase A n=1 Tax=Pedobacter sp. AW31-3R TaxID=3445781 RepID=UPI003F9F1FBD
MTDYKRAAALAAFQFLKPGQTIGLGAGTTVSNLIALIGADSALCASLNFTSSSFKTTEILRSQGLKLLHPSSLSHLDIYFDGCDQFDTALNALKSGGGIHTTEKILASMADEFILMGDESKLCPVLDGTYPLTLEILPQAQSVVMHKLANNYPDATIKLRMSTQKDGALISDNGNLLADIYFNRVLVPELVNHQVKMIPGIVDHSLFYRLATKALVAGELGTRTIYPI